MIITQFDFIKQVPKMDKIEKILENLINLLEKENKLLINAINDDKAPEEIMKIVEEKQSLLSALANFEVKDFENLPRTLKEKINKIKELTAINQTIASSNLNLIEEIFQAVFQSATTYSSEGESKKSSGSLLNKKI
jgi:flagellar biosynthesis/type III secretory pathway chaperone